MGATFNFIDIWLKMLEQNDEVRSGMYNKVMKDIFKKISTTMYKPLRPKKSTDTYDRNWWWMVYGTFSKGLPPLRFSKISKNHKIRRMKFS